jgi:hypothetical protein
MDLLWRSAMSGGRATVQLNSGKLNLNQSGDVSAIGQGAYEFCERTYVEVKHYKDLGIGRAIICGTGPLADFWRTTVKEADRYGKRPLLIARQNLYPPLAITLQTAPIFHQPPIITLHHWSAQIHIFNDVTRVRPVLVRMA